MTKEIQEKMDNEILAERIKLLFGFCAELIPYKKKLWHQAEKKKPSKDGWHFVKCPSCNGTGKRPKNG